MGKSCFLSDAVLKWCEPEDRKIYQRQCPDNFEPYIEVSGPLKPIANFLMQFPQKQQFQTRRKEALGRMREEILLELYNEELLAYGFAIGKNDRSPRLIPWEFWENAEVDWNDGTVKNGESKYNRLRIIDPYQYPELELQPKIGRKTYKKEIHSACEELYKLDNGFFQLTNKEKARLVREHIKSRYPKIDIYGPGMGDDTVRKLIKELEKKHLKA